MDATLTVRVDGVTKKKAQIILKDLGLDLSTAINLYLVQIVKKGKIPFLIEQPNDELIEALEQVNDPSKLSRPFTNVQELFDELLSDDQNKTEGK